MLRMLGLGDNVGDKYLHAGVVYPGGNCVNVAVFSMFLGASSAYMGTFGDDDIAEAIIEACNGLSIDISHCRHVEGENGFSRVLLVDGDRVFKPGNKGGISRTLPPIIDDKAKEYIAGFDFVHTSCFSYLEEQLPAMAEASKFLSMDFADKFDEDYLKRCCPHLDCAEISCGNIDESEIRDRIKKIFEYGCKHIVIATRGSKGAIVNVDGKEYVQSPCITKATDTMGAGDAFISGFLCSYVEGMKFCRDFPEGSGHNGITTADEYKDTLIRVSLGKAAVFASDQCNKPGAFDMGMTFALTDEDKSHLNS